MNGYFDGNVKSIAFNTATLPATVGAMAPGDYVFNTAGKEAVTVISGAIPPICACTDYSQFSGILLSMASNDMIINRYNAANIPTTKYP